MTQLTDKKVVCPKCQKECPKDKCGTCDWTPFKQKIVFHTTAEAALIEILQKAFWPKD